MTASITIEDIQTVYGEKEPSLSKYKKTQLKDHAESITNTNFGGKVATQSEIEGDENIFAAYVGAHLWSLSEGETLNQEFQTGNSEPRDHHIADPESWLSLTVYGTVALGMLRGQGASTSIVVSRF